jgi:hypothetical protein
MTSIPWTTVEDTFFSWIAAGAAVLGLPAKRVVWMHQRAPRPDSNATPFIQMMISQLHQFGYDWIDSADNPTPSPGNEIIQFARGQRTGILHCEFFASKGADSTGALGGAVFAEVLAQLPFFRPAFRAAGVGILEIGPARGSPQNVPVALDPRWLLDVTFSVGSEVQQPNTYIEFVDIQDNTPIWKPDTDYLRSNQVTNVGNLYQCIATGTSGAIDPSWATSHGYALGVQITNAGNVYQCITAGTSASSGPGPNTTGSDITDGTAHWEFLGIGTGGPAGTGSSIVDGSVTWKYLGSGTGSQIWIPYDPTP